MLTYLHGRNPPVIFRDLKPANIMLTPQGQIKLVDFGIARLFSPGKAGDTLVIGTPGYAPPEQYGKGQTDVRSDIYSLGVVLHTLLTRHDPALDAVRPAAGAPTQPGRLAADGSGDPEGDGVGSGTALSDGGPDAGGADR